MEIKEKLLNLITELYNKVISKKVKHVCRACHNILDEEDMSVEDSSLCKECAKRE